MEKAFRITTNLLIACLLISEALHLILFASDSESYRRWVTIQIAIQIIGAVLLVYVRKYSLSALLLFIALLIPFIFINWKFVNYANDIEHLVGASVFWIAYGFVIFGVRERIFERYRTSREKRT